MFHPERASEAIDRAHFLVSRLAELGLQQVVPATVGEIEEVARTAHHARLVRLEREVEALATQAGRYLARDPSFRTEGWIAACNRAWLLARVARRAISAGVSEAERDAALGVPRRRYDPVPGTLAVHALCAAGWVTDSGFAGVTVHLWDPVGRRILLATTARPVEMFGPDPSRLLFQPVSEVTPITVHELAHGGWTLDDVRLSSDGRLSMHGGLVATPAPPLGPAAYDAIAVDGAAGLLERLAAEELDPIGGGGAVLAWLEPSAIRCVVVDETHARVTAEIVDRAGAVLRVVTPLRPEHDRLVDNLERLAAREAPAGLVGRATLVGGQLRFEPYTAVFDTPVKLALRRAGTVQEVHLGLEPLQGEARKGGAVSLAPRVQPVPDALRWLQGDVADALGTVFSTGLGLPEPELPEALAALAERARSAGISAAAEALERLGSAVARIREGDAAARAEAHAAAQALATWARLFRAGIGVELAKRALATPGTPPPAVRRGEDRVVLPVGIEVDRVRATIHAVDARDGAWVVLQDELPGLDAGRPLAVPAPSRLFQTTVRLAVVMAHAVVLDDHPAARSGGRVLVRPAFHAAARSGDRLGQAPLPLVDVPGRQPCRVRVEARRGPDGWRLANDRETLDAVLDEGLVVELEKRSADGPTVALELVVVRTGDRVRILAADGAFPAADPAVTRWPLARLRERAGGLVPWVEALTGGPVPEDPGAGVSVPEDPRPLLDGLRRGTDVLPPARTLWALGARLGADRPIRRLGLPPWRIRLAAVAPLARWLREGGPPDDAVRDALILLVGSGEADTVVEEG